MKSIKISNRFKQTCVLVVSGICLLFFISSCKEEKTQVDDNFAFALAHKSDLQLSTYITAHSVDRLLITEAGRREAVSLLRANGISKIYIEVYRGGLVVNLSVLADVTEYFKKQGFEVVGGIATVPGDDFGMKQEGKLGWFNWQNSKTQNDLKQVMLDAAPLFDTFIVDDFLCTGDTSVESKTAKGDQSWSLYRRQLLTELAKSIFIEPARSVNSDIKMIIKYPQWYDRFHLFGYDVESGPQLFDEVWVGTETRGQYTQRFGFVQPYEGFVNYRWIASLAGDKIGGAWFDHGDCDQLDFIEQAYQSVLAGASELVLFSYDAFVQGHPGHHLLRMDFEQLASLASAVRLSPVHGISAYKPPQSDAGGDLYIMDFVGMFGVPLIPVANYPENAHTIFLPTQAASDPDIVSKVLASHQQGKRIIMTAGFLASVEDQGQLSDLAGIVKPKVKIVRAEEIIVDGKEIILERTLDLESDINIMDAAIRLEAKSGNRRIPFLIQSKDEQVFVMNSHTFSETDFEAVGEVLLCPRPLGLLDLPQSWANTVRGVFNDKMDIILDAPTRVTMQPLQNGDIILHSYNQKEVELKLSGFDFSGIIDAFNHQVVPSDGKSVQLKIAPRSRIWLTHGNNH